MEMSTNNGNEKKKIRTHFAEIIVRGNEKEPYYCILYYDPETKEYAVGFGSYHLDFVFQWRKEEFEITEWPDGVESI